MCEFSRSDHDDAVRISFRRFVLILTAVAGQSDGEANKRILDLHLSDCPQNNETSETNSSKTKRNKMIAIGY